MSYLRLELEASDANLDHVEDDEEEAAALRALAAIVDEDGVVKEGQQVAAQKVKICSCGHFTCRMIGRFGHPVPVFKESIEPLWPQSQRDKRALELK